MSIGFPYRTAALRVTQPLGVFFVAVLPAELLLTVAASDVMSAHYDEQERSYTLTGTQRAIRDGRLSQIAAYIDRVDASFPNAIILAANYNRDIGFDEDERRAVAEDECDDVSMLAVPLREWSVERTGSSSYDLIIPTGEKLAAVIDGQHRLFAFARADRDRLTMGLVCAVFLDLPKPYQAQLFATINSTQKPVDRSLTFELFGYNVSEENEQFWTPDKLSVFLTRRLGTDQASPMVGRISVAPKADIALQELASAADWKVSTAVVVDGILRLISSNPKRDSNLMRTGKPEPRRVLRSGPKDKAPLRSQFIEENDVIIYTIVKNYLLACENVFWRRAAKDSYIIKTVGIQALFDVLRKLIPRALDEKDVSEAHFSARLAAAGDINFADAAFKVPAGSGRSKIRRELEGKILI